MQKTINTLCTDGVCRLILKVNIKPCGHGYYKADVTANGTKKTLAIRAKCKYWLFDTVLKLAIEEKENIVK